MAGRFPVGYQAGDADYGTLAATGGTATHDHTGSTGSASPDIEDYVQIGCMYVTHYLDPHSHTIDTEDHRPPYAVVAFIERYA